MANLNARAWELIFRERPIIRSVREAGFFDITAEEIKGISGREPRLLTKVDFRDSLPEVMKKEWLSILAIGNGLYRIAKNDPFLDVPERGNAPVRRFSASEKFVTIDPFDISSESMALDVAKVSWILDAVFGEETELTIRWRLRKGSRFDFELGGVDYPVNGVQIEVDGGYEWAGSVNLVEAKLGGVRSLSIRQLLYPEMAWKSIVWNRRNVRSFAFVYEESIFRFIPFVAKSGIYSFDPESELAFKFNDPKDYDVMGIPLSRSPDLDFSAPFPQADDFDKILIMLKKINAAWWTTSRSELFGLMEENDLGTERQIGYYSNCLKLFKLVAIDRWTVGLTRKWFELAPQSNKEIAFEIGKALFSEKVFHSALHGWVESMGSSDLYSNWNGMGSVTLNRRKRTVSSWIRWYRNVFDLP